MYWTGVDVDGFTKQYLAQKNCSIKETLEPQNKWEPGFGSAQFHLFHKIIIRTYKSNILLFEIRFSKYQRQN